jgi:Protein of unknown function (DUF3108)
MSNRAKEITLTISVIMLLAAISVEAKLVKLSVPYHNKKIDHKISEIGFDAGEKLVFEFGWSGLSVAEAEINTELVNIEGEEYYHFSGRAHTLSIVNLLWKMNDSAESYVRAGDLKPVKFIMRQRENSLKVDAVASFDEEQIVLRKKDEYRGKVKPEKVWEYDNRGAFCPLSLAFFTRSIAYEPGDELSFEVIAGTDLYLVTFKVEARETIEVKAGKYRALRVVPTMQKLTGRIPTGDERKFRSATLWISDDKQRLPLKAESEVFIGTVFGELTQGPVTEARIVDSDTVATPQTSGFDETGDYDLGF